MLNVIRAELLKHKRNYLPYGLLFIGLGIVVYLTKLWIDLAPKDGGWGILKYLDSTMLTDKTVFYPFLMAGIPLWMGIVADLMSLPDRNNWKTLYCKPIRGGYFWGKAALLLPFGLIATLLLSLGFSYPLINEACIGEVCPINGFYWVMQLSFTAFLFQIPLFLLLLLISIAAKRVFAATFVWMAIMVWVFVQTIGDEFVQHSPTRWAIETFNTLSERAPDMKVPQEKITSYESMKSDIESTVSSLPKDKNPIQEKIRMEKSMGFYFGKRTVTVMTLPSKTLEYVRISWNRWYILEWLAWMAVISIMAQLYMRKRQIAS